MTCREVTEVLVDYLAGELPAELLIHVRQHLELCPPCVNYLQTYEITIRMTRQLPDAPPPAELLERLKAACEKPKDV